MQPRLYPRDQTGLWAKAQGVLKVEENPEIRKLGHLIRSSEGRRKYGNVQFGSSERGSGSKGTSGNAQFGSFEKHTKGFGSKMMTKLGGMGFGRDSQGIVQPGCMVVESEFRWLAVDKELKRLVVETTGTRHRVNTFCVNVQQVVHEHDKGSGVNNGQEVPTESGGVNTGQEVPSKGGGVNTGEGDQEVPSESGVVNTGQEVLIAADGQDIAVATKGGSGGMIDFADNMFNFMEDNQQVPSGLLVAFEGGIGDIIAFADNMFSYEAYDEDNKHL
ncbi:hypothetical protein Tco_0918234 [Tanacetum coccineum]